MLPHARQAFGSGGPTSSNPWPHAAQKRSPGYPIAPHEVHPRKIVGDRSVRRSSLPSLPSSRSGVSSSCIMSFNVGSACHNPPEPVPQFRRAQDFRRAFMHHIARFAPVDPYICEVAPTPTRPATRYRQTTADRQSPDCRISHFHALPSLPCSGQIPPRGRADARSVTIVSSDTI